MGIIIREFKEESGDLDEASCDECDGLVHSWENYMIDEDGDYVFHKKCYIKRFHRELQRSGIYGSVGWKLGLNV